MLNRITNGLKRVKLWTAKHSPIYSKFKVSTFHNEYFKDLRFIGHSVKMTDYSKIVNKHRLCLGNNIEFSDKNFIDASGGLLIGDNCNVNGKIELSTISNEGEFAPSVIGAGNLVDSHVTAGSYIPPRIQVDGLSSFTGEIVFVLSTGRSGSKSIIEILKNSTQVEAYHDCFAHLNSYCSKIVYGHEDHESIVKKLDQLYNATSFSDNRFHVQSDQKLAGLVQELNELFPKCKFIWLIRNASDFLNSAYLRGWYCDTEFGSESPNPKEFFEKLNTPSEFDAAFRINGYKCGEFSKEEWSKITAWERLCWYWSYWNNKIGNELKEINQERILVLKTEELSSNFKKLSDFLGIENLVIKETKFNSAKQKKLNLSDWTDEMRSIYNNYCGSLMKNMF